MEKKIWSRPMAEVETFMANEYIAKCSDTVNKYYEFVCDAGDGVRGDVWIGGTVSNGTIIGGDLLTPDERIFIFKTPGYYHACGATHYVPEGNVSTTFFNGYYNEGSYGDKTTGKFVPVVIWTANNTNVHCTKELMEKIEVVTGNKS